MAVAQLPERAEPSVRRDDVAALAEDRLHDDRRDLLGGHDPLEQEPSMWSIVGEPSSSPRGGTGMSRPSP